jgi:hypothetical protein
MVIRTLEKLRIRNPGILRDVMLQWQLCSARVTYGHEENKHRLPHRGQESREGEDQ